MGSGPIKIRIDGAEFVVDSYELGTLKVPDTLSEAEKSVARLIAQGMSNCEIADARGVSARTVGNQVSSIFAKLEINSRAELLEILFADSRRTLPVTGDWHR